MDNTDEFVFWLEAAALAGAALVGVNPTRRGAELARDIRHAECELLVTSRSSLPLLAGLGFDADSLPLLVVDEPGYREALAPFVAAYAVPDEVTGDAVMCALVLNQGAEFDPAGFADFLGAQADLGTKMAPRFVRVTATLITTATEKISRYALREQGWWDVGDDAVWTRPGRERAYAPLAAAAAATAGSVTWNSAPPP